MAAELDRDPFLPFELRGLSRENLLKELAKSPLGQALSAELQLAKCAPQVASSYHTRPQTLPAESIAELHDFWHGSKRLPQTNRCAPRNPSCRNSIRKQGDFPPFWPRDNSFLEAMETLYNQVRVKGQL